MSEYPHRYQIGFLWWETKSGRQFIHWRTVSQEVFLRKYYRWADIRSRVIDVLAIFHAGDVQRFERQLFRALPA
jgi:hypothetical protein